MPRSSICAISSCKAEFGVSFVHAAEDRDPMPLRGRGQGLEIAALEIDGAVQQAAMAGLAQPPVGAGAQAPDPAQIPAAESAASSCSCCFTSVIG